NTCPPLSPSNAKCRARLPTKTTPRERLPPQQHPRSGKQRLSRTDCWQRIDGRTCYCRFARGSPSQKRRTNRIARTTPTTASTQQKPQEQWRRFPEENKFARSARSAQRPQPGPRQKNIRRGRTSQREPRRFLKSPSVRATREAARPDARHSPTSRSASFRKPPLALPSTFPYWEV